MSRVVNLFGLCSVLSALALLSATHLQAQSLTVDGAWARAMPPTASGTAAYMTVTNSGSQAVTILGGRSPAAQHVELHTTVHEDGLMRMRAVPSLQLESGESVELAPGGLHLMVMRLSASLAAGDVLPLCILVEEGEELCFEAEVRTPQTTGQGH